MPAMSRVEALLLRSAPWRVFATKVVLPWALGEEQLSGSALEVGSGSGAMAGAILNRFLQVHLTATDYDPGMVLAAGQRLAPFGDRASVVQADAARLAFDDDTFDVALSFLMLHHVGEWEAALRELVRVVRPGGRVIGCDVIESRILTSAERTLGTGAEQLISLDAFVACAAHLGLRGWETRRKAAVAFKFVLAV